MRQPRILIVEDETIVALDMRCRLEGFGYVICGLAATGTAAITMASDHQPDLILMDIKLKGDMDGIEAGSQIRALQDVPIIFVTAFTDDDTLERVKTSSSYGYIVKPYHERELKISIELALSKFEYESKILEAKRLAEESDQAKSRFLSNISHELKTPLNAIIGFTDLAAAITEDHDLREYVTMASRSARKLECIINSLLDYTKLETGNLVPIRTVFDLEDLLLRCWEPYVLEAKAKGLAVRYYLDPGLPARIYSDESKLATILRNLIENAVKFTDSGFVLLSAKPADVRHGVTDHLIITVSDSGRGLPDSKREVLFKRFTQADDSATRSVGGLGLGLALAKGIADMLDARLEVHRPETGGTAFSLSFEMNKPLEPAWERQTGLLAGLRIGMAADWQPAGDITRWATYFGAEVQLLDKAMTTAPDCGMILSDAGAWQELAASCKRQPVAQPQNRTGSLSPVVLVEYPGSSHQAPSVDHYWHVQYPLTLAAFIESARQAIALRLQAIPDSLDRSVGMHSDRVGRPGAASGTSLYRQLFSAACQETVANHNQAALERFVKELIKFRDDPCGMETERVAKIQYDRFSAGGHQSCAHLALTILMDVRKGQGRWVSELQDLLSNDTEGILS
jgi:signal transduction histidine kinase